MYLSAPMKILTIILSGILMIAAPQDGAKQYWDTVLQKYEALCNACLNHESAREINALTKDFNSFLKSPVGKMNEEQKVRFAQIQNKYKGIITIADTSSEPDTEQGRLIKVDTIRRVEHIQVIDTAFVKEVLGEVEIKQTSTSKDTVIHIIQYRYPEKPVIEESSTPEVKEAAPVKVRAPKAPKTPNEKTVSYFILANAGIVPDLSYGAMVGAVNKWGGYVKFRSNYKFPKAAYECSSNGGTKDGYIWTNGESAVSRLAVTAGGAFEAAPWLMAYAGAGYGFSDLYWQDCEESWVKVSDEAIKGVSLDLGAIVHFGNFAFSAGVNWTGFRYLDLELGIGVFF
mgnify:CR=1 FL=1